MKKFMSKKFIVIKAVALLLFVTVGSTLAYIFTMTDPVENTFTPSKVSCAVVENVNGEQEQTQSDADTINGVTTKENVVIKNTGDTYAYIRVAVVVNWMSTDGTKVWASKPVENTDYTIRYAENTGWEKGSDGYWYYTKPVPPTEGSNLTDILINEAKVLEPAPLDGYYLSIEIVASALQAKPTSVVTSQWGVTVANDGTISN